MQAAKDLFYASVAGDKEALDPAMALLNDLGGPKSSEPQVIAYYGGADLLKAARSSWILEKGQLVKEGLALEDRAVGEAPADLEIRFLRGVTNYQLPRFMKRASIAEADLAYVARFAEPAANAGTLDRRAAAADLVYHGKVLERNYDKPGAIAAWRAALRINPGSSAAKDAAKHLEEHHASP